MWETTLMLTYSAWWQKFMPSIKDSGQKRIREYDPLR